MLRLNLPSSGTEFHKEVLTKVLENREATSILNTMVAGMEHTVSEQCAEFFLDKESKTLYAADFMYEVVDLNEDRRNEMEVAVDQAMDDIDSENSGLEKVKEEKLPKELAYRNVLNLYPTLNKKDGNTDIANIRVVFDENDTSDHPIFNSYKWISRKEIEAFQESQKDLANKEIDKQIKKWLK